MNAILIDSITGIGSHLLAFALSVLILGLFVAVFIRLTPYHEIALIKQGNTSAAISLGGCVLGFTIPLAHAVAQSTSLIDMLIWGGVALLAQVSVYSFFRMLFKDITQDIQNNKPASAIFLAAISIAVGLLNAAGMTL